MRRLNIQAFPLLKAKIVLDQIKGKDVRTAAAILCSIHPDTLQL